MNLTHAELEFLSAWAREEWEPACYQLPCHRLQLAHGVAGGATPGVHQDLDGRRGSQGPRHLERHGESAAALVVVNERGLPDPPRGGRALAQPTHPVDCVAAKRRPGDDFTPDPGCFL